MRPEKAQRFSDALQPISTLLYIGIFLAHQYLHAGVSFCLLLVLAVIYGLQIAIGIRLKQSIGLLVLRSESV